MRQNYNNVLHYEAFIRQGVWVVDSTLYIQYNKIWKDFFRGPKLEIEKCNRIICSPSKEIPITPKAITKDKQRT